MANKFHTTFPKLAHQSLFFLDKFFLLDSIIVTLFFIFYMVGSQCVSLLLRRIIATCWFRKVKVKEAQGDHIIQKVKYSTVGILLQKSYFWLNGHSSEMISLKIKK